MDNTTGSGAPRREYPEIDAVAQNLKEFLRSLEPSPEVTQHFRNARIEVLRGIRQIIDNRIEHLNRRQQSGEKITVE